jgi:hypothetical protein
VSVLILLPSHDFNDTQQARLAIPRGKGVLSL